MVRFFFCEGLALLHDRFGNRERAAEYADAVIHSLPTESFDPTFEWAGLVHVVRALALTDHEYVPVGMLFLSDHLI